MTTIVTISNCSASQIVDGQNIRIAGGDLSLEKVDSTALNAELVLRIGESFVLPIEKDSEVGTRGDRSYLFTKSLSKDGAQPQKATTDIEAGMDDVPMSPVETRSASKPDTQLMLQVDMPDTASEAELTQFEKCLVDHKFLMVGVQADADNISKTILEWAGQKTQSLRSYARSNNDSPATSPTRFDQSTHSMAQSLSSGTTIIAETASKLGSSINAGMGSIGSFLGDRIGSKGLFASSSQDSAAVAQTKTAVADGAESIGIVGAGVRDSVKDMAAATGESASAAAQHNYGKDAASLTEHARTTAANVGSTGATVLEQSSAFAHGAQIGKGAVQE